eukprot:TRINITY_DN3267_c0_g1_i2.p1 TRINITY_DN3267_c0_g1~~TRINITY_DN3267_c0_g1_i2.p1  ORF type:complete len:202 (-),score=35.19 TRINITY_DN3267_c0_g1_i2:783-1388(-)
MARMVFPMGALAALLLIAATALPASAHHHCPAKVTISSVNYAGTGCNWENTNYVLSPDYTTVTFMFGGMVATTDGGLAEKRKFCQISLGMDYPKGWSFTLGQATGRGYADIGSGSTGIYETHYYFSGETGTAKVKRVISGPTKEDYEFTDYFVTLVWSKCNNVPNLNIKTVVIAEGRKAAMMLDSIDSKFKLLFAIRWKRC